MTARSPKLPAEVRIKSYMGRDMAVVEVLEPSGQWAPWILPLSLLPEAARPKGSALSFKQGDHVLYTEVCMPGPVRVPFWRILAAKRRGKARRT